MTDDDLEDWAASRRQVAPTPAEAAGLVERWAARRRWRRVAFGTVGLTLAAAIVLFVVARLSSAPSTPDAPAPIAVVEPRTLAPGIHLEDGDTIEVAAASAVVVEAPGQILLTEGSVEIEARPRPASAPLVVRAGTAQVTVIGTVFAVTLEPFRVRVSEGVVEVVRDGTVARVAAGEVFPPPEVSEPLGLDALRELVLGGQPDQARDQLRERLARRPDDADAWALLARLETRADRTSAAREAWKAAEAHGRPRLARQARYALAVSFEERPRQAIVWLEAYLADPGPLVPEARLRLGRAQHSIRHPNADETLRSVIVDFPGTAAAASARGLLGDPP
ncbi:MAG: FecR domain-containing protein [Myxococcota bacterium]